MLKQNWQIIMLFHAFMYEIEKCLVIFVCCTRSKRFIKLNDLEVKVCVILCQDLFKMTIYLTIVKVWLEKNNMSFGKRRKIVYILKDTIQNHKYSQIILNFPGLSFSHCEDKGREFQKYFCSSLCPFFINVPWMGY